MSIPIPYAGSYYPIYNEGVGQYIPPRLNMPFDQISTLLIAFAHAYPEGVANDAAVLKLEFEIEHERLPLVVKTAREVNPNIKILISLGWGHDDWTFISNDYNGQKMFPQSVVDLVTKYELDGFDIDDESIGGSSGSITQEDFNGVVGEIREKLDIAGHEQGKPMYFTITPAGGTAQVTNDNILLFDVINTQNYGGSFYDDFIGFPNAKKSQFAYGVVCEGQVPRLPEPSVTEGMAGMFNWTMSADSAFNYETTKEIAQRVGYGQPTQVES